MMTGQGTTRQEHAAGPMRAACGCTVTAYHDGSDRGVEIHYCDVHVAAPDLLAACKRALSLLMLSGAGRLAKTPAADDLRAAIAKARGEAAQS